MFYSKMYYACQVWLTNNLKNKFFSLSAKALQTIDGNDFDLFSFEELHVLFLRSTPIQFSNYMHANQLYSIINNKVPYNMWLKSQLNQSICQCLCFPDFNISKNAFKILCKRTFL